MLALAPAARLRVRCEGAEGHASVRVQQDGLTVAADGVEAGSTRTFVVPARPLVVRAASPRAPQPEETTLQLAAGETRDLVVVAR